MRAVSRSSWSKDSGFARPSRKFEPRTLGLRNRAYAAAGLGWQTWPQSFENAFVAEKCLRAWLAGQHDCVRLN
jgi:hypothetical protein